MSQCAPQFEKDIPFGCAMEVFAEVRTSQFNAKTATKVMWLVGCLTTRFVVDEVPVPPTNGFFVSFGESPESDSDPELELESRIKTIAAHLERSVDGSHEFAATPFASNAASISPATLALLIQLGQLALQWLASRSKS